MARIIAHVDMDAFYASVEQRDRPALRGRPVIVGGRPEQRGVVAAASYEARAYGVHSAMPTARALRRCPQAVLLPSRFAHYRDVSRQIRAVFLGYTPLVEPLSLDEAFLDLSAHARAADAHTVKAVRELGRALKRDVAAATRLTCSVGLAPSKFLAKLASEQDKPDGLTVVRRADVRDFLDRLPLERLWGVGPATLHKLRELGIETLPQLRAERLPRLIRHLGAHGAHLWELAHGRDERPVVPDRPSKSLSRETTFPEDLGERRAMKDVLRPLCGELADALARHGLHGRTVHLKVRLADFTTLTRNATLAWPTQDAAALWQAVERLFERRVDTAGQGVRLLGVGVSGLSDCGRGQLPLWPLDAPP